jgi:hypothetical protein
MPHSRLKSYLAALAALGAAGLATCAWLAQGPDRDLHFVREVPTSLPADTLNQSFWSIGNWPNWFFTMADVKRVDVEGRIMSMRDQTLAKGALIQFEVDPKKSRRRRFELLAEVTEYVPQKLLALRILRDSSGKILKLVDRLEWRIELLPAEGGRPGLIRGIETAHTRHWRARLMGALWERTFMNQLFYPDLMTLGQFTTPSAPNPYPVYGQ